MEVHQLEAMKLINRGIKVLLLLMLISQIEGISSSKERNLKVDFYCKRLFLKLITFTTKEWSDVCEKDLYSYTHCIFLFKPNSVWY